MKVETKFVKPLEGVIVRDPSTFAIIPADGTTVPWIGKHGRFYRRRVKDGSLIICKQEKKPSLFQDEDKKFKSEDKK